jgi:tetratricopeptide (TPR) repeat protein
MHLISSFQHPPPSNEDDFEKLCLALWKRIWDDPSAQLVGRRGQGQHGVDVVGICAGRGFAGVQCKCKGVSLGKTLTEKELRDEVEKAKGFTPPLVEFTMATTAPRDAGNQEIARTITAEHIALGIFRVSVWSWDDIVVELDHHPDLAKVYLSGGIPSVPAGGEGVVLKSGGSTLVDVGYVLLPEHQAEADFAKRLLEQHQVDEASEYLEALKARIWPGGRPEVKARVAALLAEARHRRQDNRGAASEFFEASRLEQDPIRSHYYRGAGHLLLGEHGKAHSEAREILGLNPASEGGYSLLLQTLSVEEDLRASIAVMPDVVRGSRAVCYAAGLGALRRGDRELAIEWLERAAEPSDPEHVEAAGVFGTALLERVGELWPRIAAGETTEEGRSLAVRAAGILEAAWAGIRTTSLRQHRVHWLLNLVTALDVLERQSEAIAELEAARRLLPANRAIDQRLALLHLRRGEARDAAAVLASLDRAGSLDSDGRILYAGALEDAGDNEAAIEQLRKAVGESRDADVLLFARRKLADSLAVAQEGEEAKRILADLRREYPDDLGVRLDEIRVLKIVGETGIVDRLTSEVLENLRGDESPIELNRLAALLMALERFGEAATVFERFVTLPSASPNARNLAYCCYRSDRRDRCLEVCAAARKRYGASPQFAELETNVLLEIGDRVSALNVLRMYSRARPDDTALQVRIAMLEHQEGNTAAVDQFLDARPRAESLSLERSVQLALLYRERGRGREALDVLYELRRKYFHERSAHEAYIGLCFEQTHNSTGLDDWLNEPERVAIGSAAHLQAPSGESRWFLIDERDDPDLRLNELSPSHLTARALLGSRVGDQVDLGESDVWTIEAVKSKYLFALHDSLENFSRLFPGQAPFKTLQITTGSDGLPTTGAVKSFFEKVAIPSEGRRQLFEAFKAGQIPMYSMAKRAGKDVLELWRVSTESVDIGLRCARGTPGEIERALDDLRGTVRLAADVTALLTLQYLGLIGVVAETFGRPLVARSTLDLLDKVVMERAARVRHGYRTVTFYAGIPTLHEATEDELRADLDFVERLRATVDSACDIAPVTAALTFDRDRRNELEAAFGESFVDTALLALAEGTLLYSDDVVFREVASQEPGVRGIWTQPVVVYCQTAGRLTEAEVDDATLGMLGLNYHLIRLDAATLAGAALRSGWRPRPPFIGTAAALRPDRCDEDSAVAVAAEFLHRVLLEPMPWNSRDMLTIEILGQLTSGLPSASQRRWVAERLQSALARAAAKHPQRQQLLGIISLWIEIVT